MATKVVTGEPATLSQEQHQRLYDATPYTGWRTRVRDWTPLIGEENQELLERVRDKVYGIVLDTGADLKTICAYFGWDIATARSQIQPVIEMAKAELKLTVLENQLSFALATKQPLAKIAAGRQFADQTDYAPQGDGAGSNSATGLFDGLTVTETHRDSNGQTTQEPTHLRLVKAG
jgi:hypothetical protein